MLFLNKTFDNLKGKQRKSIEIEILQTKACRLNFQIKNSIKIAMTHMWNHWDFSLKIFESSSEATFILASNVLRNFRYSASVNAFRVIYRVYSRSKYEYLICPFFVLIKSRPRPLHVGWNQHQQIQHLSTTGWGKRSSLLCSVSLSGNKSDGEQCLLCK